ncbi:hypothetical protein EDD11_003994 [Mortierella claussenii]|nr:hypothetical protein EDD11_003994 [Mortierella claussenii]
MSQLDGTALPSAPLPSLIDIVQDLSLLQAAFISLSQQQPLDSTESPDQESTDSSIQKLQRFKASTEKSQRDEGVVESGFQVAADFLKMQRQLSVSKQEMNTLQERLTGLEKELTEVRELIAFNPIK